MFARGSSHAIGPLIVLGYGAVAVVLGVEAGPVSHVVFGDRVSPLASPSASAILSAIASGTMALTAIVFSLLFVAMPYGSAAFGPRVARLLGDNLAFLHSLGIFTGTFTYSLVALRAVDRAGQAGVGLGVVTLAFAWLAASLIALTLLLPRIRGLSIERVLRVLEERTVAAAHRIYPVRGSSAASARPELPPGRALVHEGRPVYLVGFDVERLVARARRASAVISIPLAIGDAVVRGDRIATIHGDLDERVVRRAIWFDDERLIDNDPAYGLRLIADIGIRALSAGINDPTTAVSVLDELAGVLHELAHRELEHAEERDRDGVVRLVREVATWEDLVALALAEIHQYGCDCVQVQRRLGTLLDDLRDRVPPDRRPALDQFARWRVHTLGNTRWVDPLACDRQGLGHLRAS